MDYNVNFDGFLRAFQNIVNDVVRSLNNDDVSVDLMDAAVNRMNGLWRNLGRMTASYPQCNLLMEDLQNLIHIIDEMKRSNQQHIGLRLPRVGEIGRPRYLISREQLEFLVEMGFSSKTMARLLHVSISSVKRRLSSYRISLRRRYTNITDDDLDDHVKRITQFNRSLGQRLVQGILKSERILVQRRRVAESLIRVDEAGVAIRWCRTIRRRSYSVSGPNSLWHVDGNHKLIRWGMVVHGGIDGYSRLAVFLNLALNNRATTAFAPFINACQEFGVPSRVRTDHGLENLDIGTFMIAHRGPDRGSIITGRSVHNQRIERLWRDMFQSCTNVFHKLFHYFENHGYLDISNTTHLWCLQYVYAPRIQTALDVFKDGWNNHSVSTEGGETPKQIFVRGALQQAGQGHCGIDDLFREGEVTEEDIENYGVDWNGPVPENEQQTVTVQETTCPITPERLQQLRQEVNPLSEPSGLGIGLYLRTLAFCIPNE